MSPSPSPQPMVHPMRVMLYVAAALVFVVGVSLFLLTEQTDRYFAWTIQSSLTAAFLGAAYLSSCVLEVLSARQRWWANARSGVPAVIVFTGLTLLVTLLHLDRFHFNAPELTTRAGTWFWLAIYIAVPIIMGVLFVRQMQVPGTDPPRRAPMPGWMTYGLGLIAAALLLLGAALLLAPAALIPLWPWALTPLTARAIGAWMVGLGLATGLAARERDMLRTRPVRLSAMVFCVLQFVALARYADQMAWGSASGWAYIGLLVVFLAIGIYATLATARSGDPAALAGNRGA